MGSRGGERPQAAVWQARGGTQAPATCAGDVPLKGGPMLGLLGALGLELVVLQHGWELGTTTGAHPHPPRPRVLAGTGECLLLAAGALQVAPADVPSMRLPQKYF